MQGVVSAEMDVTRRRSKGRLIGRAEKFNEQDEGWPPAVTLSVTDEHVVIDNGILKVTWTVPEGQLIGIHYAGVDNLLETHNKESNRGYWDIVWGKMKNESYTYWLIGSTFKIIREDDNQTEISFSSRWNPATWNSSTDYSSLPINLDKRYIMLRGCSGFHSYAILERQQGWPSANIYQIRAVFKLHGDMFHYMAVSDDRQGIMPTLLDRESGQILDYKEAVLLTNPSNPELKGQVDDKYQFSSDYKDNKVHGWISFNSSIGFWMIMPSNEFRSAGPVKQDLTSHTGPITLAMFHSAHYAGLNVTMEFEEGEPWKKVFGPFFIYLNSACENEDALLLWDDAKNKMSEEVRSWPYEFPSSEDFPKGDQRGSVKGQLLVCDWFIANNTLLFGHSAWVGLAQPGEVGSWQTETKGYQFWTKANCYGNFTIKGVREGNYSLYAWVPGHLGDYKYMHNISITPGCKINLGILIFQPSRNGPTLWEIGVPDRTAAEFFVPETDKLYENKLIAHSDCNRFRQYGLWKRYAELYPLGDLKFTVGVSNFSRDWFFAQVTRQVSNATFKSTTWHIIFRLEDVELCANYTLWITLASATESDLQVRFNVVPELSDPHFKTTMIGRDNAIARHGIHGLYWLFGIDIPGIWLRCGHNTIYLTQSRHQSPFQGIMYDYIRTKLFSGAHDLHLRFSSASVT
ncbi:hypothetical protein Nepgr_026504 [Nepenthes gracilis]|uniref:rhamnogalacturonan endolyase n=1 Tax=Nepenthes gracilis TaxID=150966 RepID=A0AAD3Y2J6_NEPGR|nr:hypothetical protein Nepgr_026504 [Nepenthes gracilis]